MQNGCSCRLETSLGYTAAVTALPFALAAVANELASIVFHMAFRMTAAIASQRRWVMRQRRRPCLWHLDTVVLAVLMVVRKIIGIATVAETASTTARHVETAIDPQRLWPYSWRVHSVCPGPRTARPVSRKCRQQPTTR